ncbi:X-ray repair cross-complementing protein 5-like [Halichondria panicea]|uniref:X-ray repair cross-complementing protein 5-like n=1 Tax=Halichondria panicea TaxID=6063 RepID=UPI00312B91AE
MAKAQDCVIVCVDVGYSMSFAPPSGGNTYLEMAVKVANQIIQQKMFAGSKDLVGLVLFGTAETDNELASREGGYDNISVPYLPTNPSLDLLKFLNQVQAGAVSADFIDALVVAMDSLVNATRSLKKVGEKKIYLLTDAGSEYSDDGLESICAGLEKEGIELVVVGPSISPGGGNTGDSGSPGDGPGPSYRPPPSVTKKTPQQIAGEGVLQRIVETVDGLCFSFHEELQMASLIRKGAKRQTARFSGNLEIGKQFQIACKIYTKTMEEKPPSWKKLSAVSQASSKPESMGVKMHRSYHLNDEDETEVDMDNVAKGYWYGKSLIPVSDADEKAMALQAPRCLSLLGFSKRSSIKNHQTLGNGVQVVVANPDDKAGCVSLSAFIHALYETDMVMVCRYVWRNNSQPKLVVLAPHIKPDKEYLLMRQVPFTEDVRCFVFPSLPGERKSNQPTEEQLSAVDDLITNMDLMKADVDEDGRPCEALKPKNTPNPLIQRIFQCVAHRALHPTDPLPEVDPSIKRLVTPSPAILTQCSGALNRIKDVFPLTKVEAKESEASTAWKKTSDLDLDAEAPPAKKARVEEDTDFSMASLARGEVKQVGTLDPVGDFTTLLKQGSLLSAACKMLQEVAVKLVKESFGDTYYGKAMDCIQALRSEAIKQSEPTVFNPFLRELKSDFVGTRYAAFWSHVTSEGVTLVSSVECGVSDVTPEQAKQFIEEEASVTESSPAPPEVTDDADGLLAMM